MKFSTAALKTSILSSFLRATTLFATLFVANVDGQVQLSLGVSHTCAFDLSSTLLKCWGYNGYYQLNTGDTTDRLTPVGVTFPGIGNLVGAEAGGQSTCGINDDGGVKCVGRNDYGQLGNGTTNTPISTATTMQTLSEKVSKVSVGYHSCIIYIGGGLACTGRNDYGQLGFNNTISQSTPMVVVDSKNKVVKDVDVGDYHTCFQNLEDSLLWCMGRNREGQLGVGDNTARRTPVMVSLAGNKNVLTFSVGYYHVCAIGIDNLVQCWGRNQYGQLGVGDNIDRNSPTLGTSQGSNAEKIAAGQYHTCFLKNDATIWCMGYNNWGQLGNSSTTDSNTPVQVNLPASITPLDIETGNAHSCISTDTINKIYCWGQGASGQLGNGGTDIKTTPTLVQSLDWLAPLPSTSSPTRKSANFPTKKPNNAPSEATSAPTKKPTPAPMQSPIVSLYATAVCGGATNKCNPQTKVDLKTATYGVRCCSETEFKRSKKKDGCNVWAASRVGKKLILTDNNCKLSATFQQAKSYCEHSSARLCTKQELLDQCAKSTGCGLNHKLVWSSEPVVAPPLQG